MIRVQSWLLGAVMLAAAQGLMADEAKKGQEVVDKSKITFDEFVADPNMGWFRSHVHQAKGLLIVPWYGKAGFILGGAGGSGVLLGRDGSKGTWSHPAFYTMAEASIGFQIGAQGSAMVFLIMTDKGMSKMVDGKAKLGADMNVAVGPVGGGATVETADVYAFAKSKGAYGGVSVQGGVVQVFGERNKAYYAKSVGPRDIVMKQAVSSPGSQPLVDSVSRKLGG